MTTQTLTPTADCPHCGRANDRATGKSGTRPKPGDVAICWGCHRVAIYVDANGVQRLPTDAEERELLADREVQRAIAHMKTEPTPVRAARKSLDAS